MTDQTFVFYDLETSGISARHSRIMQFAGQRTDLSLKPIGKPYNILIKLTEDVLPEPDAVMLTGITPQKTLSDGITESEFLRIFHSEIAVPGTTFVGFNSVRFDDEFIRFINYRNYYDAYTWQWKDSRSRWDILDMVRMTRALRPDRIEWPFSSEGKPTNRLEYLTSVNKLEHSNAHDALADVNATISVAGMIADKQPELFKYLLGLRDKKEVSKLINQQLPLVYTSGRYPSINLHTTVVFPVAVHSSQDSAIVFDLRHDPEPYLGMTAQELASIWRFTRDPNEKTLPVKTVKYNRCPALAPLGVIKDKKTEQRINLDRKQVDANLKKLKNKQLEFADKLLAAAAILDKQRLTSQIALVDNLYTVDERLYDGFINDRDKSVMDKMCTTVPEDVLALSSEFSDERLKNLALLYKARNYPGKLTSEEAEQWENYRRYQFFHDAENSRAAKYFNRIEELSHQAKTDRQKYLLEELKLYGESVLPTD